MNSFSLREKVRMRGIFAAGAFCCAVMINKD
jgi:hypothetical protein